MPDLTIEYCYTCPSNVSWSKTYKGSKGDSYEVTYNQWNGPDMWHCTCPGFKYRKTCKHVESAKTDRCGWNWEAYTGSKGNPIYKNNGVKCCPDCGEEVEIVKVGV